MDTDSLTYIVRQPGQSDLECADSKEAVEQFLKSPGPADVFVGEQLILSKGSFDGRMVLR